MHTGGVSSNTVESPTKHSGLVKRNGNKLRKGVTLGLLAIWGPGIIVMLADTDVGSTITAAQSGATWGYRLLLPELLLVPILYVVQEMTARLGIVTGKGHAALIREHFGKGWALLSGTTLVASAVGALVTEFAGVAGVGELFGISEWITVPVATVFLIALAFSGSYRRVERVGLALGLAELVFVPAMLLSHPHVTTMVRQATNLPLHNSSFVFLLAANIGAVIMPWMIFYQQGAVIDKLIPSGALRQERLDTGVGAILTQAIMIIIIIVFAATVGRTSSGAPLQTVGEMSRALQPFLGNLTAKVLLGIAILGAGLVAALVASLAGAWGLSEVLGWKHSLNERSKGELRFYVTYGLAHILGAAVVLASVDLISLAVDVEVMNAMLLPIVLGFLLLLEAKALPQSYRMHGAYKIATWFLCLVVIGFGLYMIPATLHL